MKRWAQHKVEARSDRSQSRALYRAIKKYGIDNFSFEILEETDEASKREQFYIQKYNSFHFGYNETLGGDGSPFLELPEQDICKFYLERKSVKATAEHFCHDSETISKILYKNNIPVEKYPAIEKSKKAVARLDKDTGEILEIIPSIAEANRKYDSSRHVGHVCQGKRKTAGGFKWRYVDELEEGEQELWIGRQKFANILITPQMYMDRIMSG